MQHLVAFPGEPCEIGRFVRKQLRQCGRPFALGLAFAQMKCDFEQTIVGQREKRRAQRRRQCGRVARVIDRGKQFHEVDHLGASEKAAPFDRVAGDLRVDESALVNRNIGECAHQYCDVTVVRRTHSFVAWVDDRRIGSDETLDSACQRTRLDPAFLSRALVACDRGQILDRRFIRGFAYRL